MNFFLNYKRISKYLIYWNNKKEARWNEYENFRESKVSFFCELTFPKKKHAWV